MEKKNILITGFGPFDGHNVNASWEAVKPLRNYEIQGYNLIIEEVPVIYNYVDKFIPEAWSKYTPHIVVHVGVSSSAKGITLEACAHRAGYTRMDASGETHPTGEVVPESEGPNAIKTEFEVEKLCDTLTTDKIRFIPSKDAGRFLCEYIYYSSLNNSDKNTLFIHVPPLDSPYTTEELTESIFQTLLALEDILNNRQ